MTKRPSVLFLAALGALLALIGLVLGPGRVLLPDRGAGMDEQSPTYLNDQLVQLADLTPPPPEPINWGPFRVVPHGSEEYIRYFASPNQPPTAEEKAEAEEFLGNPLSNLADARVRIPGGLREPHWLPDGVVASSISGGIGFQTHYNAEVYYVKPGPVIAGQQKFDATIRVGQQAGAKLPIPATNARTTASETMLGYVQGEPAVFILPTTAAVPTTCRLAKWVKDRVLLVVEACGFSDLATMLRVAESIR